MNDGPDIVKELREAEKLGVLQHKVQNAYGKLETVEEKPEGIPNKTIGFADDYVESGEGTCVISDRNRRAGCQDIENKYRLIAETTSDLICTTTFSLKPVYTYVNSSYAKTLGYHPEEMIGKSSLDFMHPDDKKDLTPILKKYFSMKAKKLFTGKEHEIVEKFECRLRDKSGNWHYLENTANILGKEILFISKDNTEKRQIDSKLKESENRYQTVFENTGTATGVFGNDSVITMINSEFEKLVGFTRDEVENKMHWFDFVTEEDKKRMFEYHEQRTKHMGKPPNEYDFTIVDKKGNLKKVHLRIGLVPGTSNRIVSLIDITDREKTIEKVRTTSGKLQKIINASPSSIITGDSEGKITGWNNASEKIFGWKADEVIGNFNPTVPEGMKEFYLKTIKEEQINLEIKALRKDNSMIDVFISSAPLYDNKGNYNGSLSVMTDISERKKIERKFKENEEKFRSLFESMNEGVGLHDMVYDDSGDASDYRIIDVNPKFEKILNLNKEDVINKLASEIFETDEAPYLNIYKKVVETGEPTQFETYFSPMDKYFSISVFSPLRGKFATIFEDITECKNAEENLKIMDNAIASSINAIVIAGLDCNLTYVNPSFLKLFKYNNEKEVLGKPVFKFWKTKGRFIDMVDALADANGWVGELVAERKDGSLFDVQISSSMVKDEAGKPVCMMASFVDVTEQKQAEEKIRQQNIQLKKLDRIKSEFLNVTSHELRTPMSAIKGYTQMVLEQALGEITEEQKKALNVVLRNTTRLDHLIQDILDISRLESGTMKFIPEQTNLRKMIEDVYETMTSAAKLKDIKIKMDVEDNLPDLIIDQDRIKQVIINIVNNAIKFSPDGSIINVRAKKEKDDVLFEIQDYGKGIPKDKQKKIFDTFYQVDSGMDRKFGGAGLGLAISRGIVLSHGGKIDVKSTVGNGSTFQFRLPLKPVENLEDRFKEVDIFGLDNHNYK